MLELTNDRMEPIRAMEDWTLPKHAYQWVDGRSAKELDGVESVNLLVGKIVTVLPA